ncbi:hypothetical protein QQX10_05965 [Demequina sp. SYSU T00039]|uniref:DUF4352 domain-containing protein n=1 Tax=Demequina lignilytica TaxID=3051663 RepID=A0AAW7M682_9MICO|nr:MULTISPECIES: hypothetical protein [unclassified Demequina]MDN4477802.1 hypothetical protein [Demequina sp. SYSU T00039-1]MDN4487711.1 hypothetical protein [Demequina sp. SYSU T00039]MDN4490906.1 hypothetical protein [Demequina sp. SYSU T00068]
MSELHTLVAGLSWNEPATASSPDGGRRRRQIATGIGAAMLSLAGGAPGVAVEVGQADWAADDAVAQENMFNSAAPAGTSYVMVPVTVSNGDGDAVVPRAVVSVTYRAEDGRTFSPERQVVPADLDEIAELAPGETATGNVLFAIPDDARGAGAWVVELSTGDGAELAFTAL